MTKMERRKRTSKPPKSTFFHYWKPNICGYLLEASSTGLEIGAVSKSGHFLCKIQRLLYISSHRSMRFQVWNSTSAVGQFWAYFEGVSCFELNVFISFSSFDEYRSVWTNGRKILAIRTNFEGEMHFASISMRSVETSSQPPLLQNTLTCWIPTNFAKKVFCKDFEMGRGFFFFFPGQSRNLISLLYTLSRFKISHKPRWVEIRLWTGKSGFATVEENQCSLFSEVIIRHVLFCVSLFAF